MRKIIIEKEIFEKFPDFKRWVIIVKNIKNNLENEEIRKLLDSQVEDKKSWVALESPNVKSWDEMHLSFGSNPNKFPPSIKSLLKRVRNSWDLPFVNSVVALFNYISLKYIVTCGWDDTETIAWNLCLWLAKWDENFIGLWSTENEHPEVNEIIYFDTEARNVMCRKLNWRNWSFTKIQESTNKMVINIDWIWSIDKDTIIAARDELTELLQKFSRAEIEVNYLDKDNSEIEINL